MAATSSSGGVPPGFRFHPTDEDLLHYYLKKKISFQKFDMEVIREVDLNKIEPWDLQERCKIGSTPQNEWYFFSHKDRKYPTGSRTNRATSAGFWKATGRDKCIRNSSKKIGMRKTLVFYRGRAPHGQKTDWIMHEYRLEDGDHHDPLSRNLINSSEDGWVICRVFKKKNLFKIGGNEGICGGSTGGSGLGGGNASMVGSSDQLSNLGNQSRTMFSHSINNHNNRSDMNSQYLLPHHHHHHHHHQQQNFVDLGLNYTHMALMPSYPHDHLQAHDFIPTTTHHKPLGVYVNPDFSSPTLPSDDAPLMVRQLMSSNPPPPCDQCDDSTGSDHQNNRPLGNFNQSSTNICNQEEPVPLEIGNNCEANSQSNMNNEWGVNMDHHQRLVHEDASTKGVVVFEEANPSSSSLHQINQLSLRGEMDFWGYEK